MHHRPGCKQEIIWIATGRPALLLGRDGRFPDRLVEPLVRGVELGVGLEEVTAAGDQPEVGRVLDGEADVARADGPVPIESGITGLGRPSEQGGLESLQDVGGERGQQRGLVGEMARRCPVRNSRAAGEAPQAEPTDPVLANRFCGLLEEDLTEVPVVGDGPPRRRRRYSM